MSDRVAFPPFRDLTPSRLSARKKHLLDEIAAPGRGGAWPGALLAAVVVVALVVASVAIAAGFGAFRGISAAEHTPVGASVLPAQVRASVAAENARAAAFRKAHHTSWPAYLLPKTARVLGETSNGSKVYGLTDTRGDLCLIGGGLGSCGPPLSKSHPITFMASNRSPTTGGTFIASGIAMDGVTAVSFKVWSRDVTVPVRKNVWIYEKLHSTAHDATCIVAHLADGSSVIPFPEAPCRETRR